MNELNALIAGFCGGCISSIMIIMNYYFHIRYKTKQYVETKEIMKDKINLINVIEDMKELRIQINEIYEEMGKKQF